MRLPRSNELECLDFLSRRRAIRRSTVPPRFREAVRAMLRARDDDPRSAWLEPSDVVLVEITPIGRALAAAYRAGRAAMPIGQREMDGTG
jgi:hypothetical protein